MPAAHGPKAHPFVQPSGNALGSGKMAKPRSAQRANRSPLRRAICWPIRSIAYQKTLPRQPPVSPAIRHSPPILRLARFSKGGRSFSPPSSPPTLAQGRSQPFFAADTRPRPLTAFFRRRHSPRVVHDPSSLALLAAAFTPGSRNLPNIHPCQSRSRDSYPCVPFAPIVGFRS
jgi:hypothetical protein